MQFPGQRQAAPEKKDHPLLHPNFATTGLHVHHTGLPPTRFQVLGERSSGTNFVKRLLGRNTALKPTEAVGWKHGFPQMLAIPADLAVVCVVRNPADWALSMHAKPWHTTAAMQALPFSDFIRAPWNSIIDRPRYFEGSVELGIVGQPLQADRDPTTGAAFSSLFALRRAKLTSLLSHLNRGCTCVLLRLEAVQAKPEETVTDLLNALSMPPHDGPFRPVTKRLGSKFKPAIASRPETPNQLSADDRAFMAQELNKLTETQLGYDI